MLTTIKRQSMYGQVVELLKSYILENDLRPGDRLPTEAEIAAKLRVSRQTVREAIKVLESVGLIETRPRDGSRLKETNTSELTDHLHFMFALDGVTFEEMAATRSVIESAFLPSVVQNAEESDFQQMEATIAAMRENINNVDTFARADMKFHQALFAATKNRMMASFGTMLQDFFAKRLGQADARTKSALQALRDHEQTIQDHEQIVAALRAKDVKKASQLVHHHFRNYGVPDSIYPDA